MSLTIIIWSNIQSVESVVQTLFATFLNRALISELPDGTVWFFPHSYAVAGVGTLISRDAPWPGTFEGRSTDWATAPRQLPKLESTRAVKSRNSKRLPMVSGLIKAETKLWRIFLRRIMNFDEAIKTVIDSVADEVAIWKKSGLWGPCLIKLNLIKTRLARTSHSFWEILVARNFDINWS